MPIDIELIKIVEQAIAEKYQAELNELKKENEKLREKLNEVEEKVKEQEQAEIVPPTPGLNGPINTERFEALENELHALKDLISHLKSEPEEVLYDLRKEFDEKEILFAESKLKLDRESKAVSAQILKSVFKKQLESQKKKVSAGFENYKFPVRAIETVLTLKE